MKKAVVYDTSEKKGFLESYLKIMGAAYSLEEELRDWTELAEGDPVEGLYTANIVLKKQEVEKLKNEALAVKMKILEATDLIEDKRIRNILRRHYIHGQSIKKIAKVMYYSERYVKRLHKKGVELIEIINLTTP